MAISTWIADGASGNLASTAVNWDTIPSSGRDIVFDASSVVNCTWDLALALGSFSMNTGYTGTVTQAASFSVTSYLQAAGTFTGSTSYTLTDFGEFSQSGGTITGNVLQVTMFGNGATISAVTGNAFASLTINENISLGSAMIVRNQVIIASGKTFSLGAKSFYHFIGALPAGDLDNEGAITSTTGTYFLRLYDYDKTPTKIGTFNAKLQVDHANAGAVSHVFTLPSNTVLGSSLTVLSLHATHTITLELSSSNFTLSATDITIGTRGILNGRGSVITCNGTFDSSAGAFTQGTSTLICAATGNLKCAADGVYNLRVASGVTTTLTAALNVYKDLRNNGTLTRGANTVSLLGAGEQTVSGYPDTAITVNSTGPVIFLDCAHHPIDTTFTAGACVWIGLAQYSPYYTYGNLSISAVSRKPTPYQDLDNGSGTLTLDVETRVKDLKTSAGATTVQSAGVQIGIAGKINTIGTLTINTPTKVLRDHDAVRLVPFPVQFCVNQPKGWGDA